MVDDGWTDIFFGSLLNKFSTGYVVFILMLVAHLCPNL